MQTQTESKNPQNPTRTVVAIRASTVREEKTEWFLNGRIPASEFCLIIGREGLGKSTLTLELLAQATNGTLDGCHYGEPINVAAIANEDSLQKTLKPRVTVAGADLDRVFFIATESIGSTHNGTLVLPNDLVQLTETIRHNNIRAIVLDPIVGILNERVDTHNYASTKQALQVLNQLAQNTNVTVLAVTHENKSNSQDFSRRANGSVAFTTTARAVLGVIRDPQDQTGQTLVFGNSKSNYGRLDLPAKRFQIVGAQTPSGIESSRVQWLEDSTTPFTELSTDTRTVEERSEDNDTVSFLRDLLETNAGEIAAREAQEQLAKNGLPTKGGSLDRAKRSLGIRTEQRRTDNRQQWFWKLPHTQADSVDSWIQPTTAMQTTIQPLDSVDSTPMSMNLREQLDSEKPACTVCGKPLALADLMTNATVHGFCE